MSADPEKRKLRILIVTHILVVFVLATAVVLASSRESQLTTIFIAGLTLLISDRVVERILRFTPSYKTPLGALVIAVIPGIHIAGLDLMSGNWWTTAIAAAVSIVAGFMLWPQRGRWFANSRPWVRSFHALSFSLYSGFVVIGLAGFAWWSIHAIGPQPQPAGVLRSLPAPTPAAIASGRALAEFAERVGAEIRTDTFLCHREPDSIPLAEARARGNAWNDTLAKWLVLVEQPEIVLPGWRPGQHLISGSIHPANLLALRVRVLSTDGDGEAAGALAARLLAAGTSLQRKAQDRQNYSIAQAITSAGLDGARLWFAATAGTGARHSGLEGATAQLLRAAEAGYREAIISHYREQAEQLNDTNFSAVAENDEVQIGPGPSWLLYDPVREEIYQENQYWAFAELAALPFPLAAREHARLQAEEGRRRGFPDALFWRDPTNLLPGLLRYNYTGMVFGLLKLRELTRAKARAVQLAFALRAGTGQSADSFQNPLTGEPLRVDTSARRVIVDCPDIPEIFKTGEAGKELWSVRW